MNIKSIAFLALVPLLFGCASTTVKTYSADFKAYPVETKDEGRIITTSDGEKYEIKQQYKFEGILTETSQIDDEPATSKEKSNLTVTTRLGSSGKVKIGPTKGISRGKPWSCNDEMSLEVLTEEKDNQLTASLKLVFKEEGSEPIVCSQTITIEK